MKKIVLAVCILSLVLVGCTSKPSKESVREGFRASLIDQLGANAPDDQKEQIEKYADCIVDETYEKLSAKTAKKFAETKTADEFDKVSGTKEEKAALDEAVEVCAGKAISPAGK